LPKLKVVVTHLEKYWDKIFARGIQVNIQGETKTIFPHRTTDFVILIFNASQI
jgi:hypothetical protein